MAIAAAIPWSTLISALPTVVSTAREVWNHWSSRKPPQIDPNADLKTQVAALTERVAALEAAETEQAKVVSQIAEQLQAIAQRAQLAYWFGISGIALACAALLFAFLR